MFCIHCGKEISDNSIFCIHCGQKVSSLSSAPTATETKDSEPILSGTDPASSFATATNAVHVADQSIHTIPVNTSAFPTVKRRYGKGIIIAVALAIIAIIILIPKNSVIGDTKQLVFEDIGNVELGDAVEKTLEDEEWTYEKVDKNHYKVTVQGFCPSLVGNIGVTFDVYYSGDNVYGKIVSASYDNEVYTDTYSTNLVLAILYGQKNSLTPDTSYNDTDTPSSSGSSFEDEQEYLYLLREESTAELYWYEDDITGAYFQESLGIYIEISAYCDDHGGAIYFLTYRSQDENGNMVLLESIPSWSESEDRDYHSVMFSLSPYFSKHNGVVEISCSSGRYTLCSTVDNCTDTYGDYYPLQDLNG